MVFFCHRNCIPSVSKIISAVEFFWWLVHVGFPFPSDNHTGKGEHCSGKEHLQSSPRQRGLHGCSQVRQIPHSWTLNSHWRDQQLTRSDVFIKFQLHSWNSAAHASRCYDVNWMEYFVIWSFTFSVSADICAILALTTTSFDVDKTIHAPNLIFPSKNDTLVLKKQGKFITPLEIWRHMSAYQPHDTTDNNVTATQQSLTHHSRNSSL